MGFLDDQKPDPNFKLQKQAPSYVGNSIFQDACFLQEGEPSNEI